MEELELTPKQAKEVIQFYFERMPHLPILLCGPSGIGKTDISRQIARENQWDYLDIRLAGMLPEDLRGYPKAETWADVVARDSLGVEGAMFPQLQFVLIDKLSMVFETEGPGVLDFEELNRAHPDVHQPIFQLIGDRAMDDRLMGDKWRIIGSINPDDDNDYIVNVMDMAFTRRWLYINIIPDIHSWLDYAEKASFHKVVVDYLKANPTMLYKRVSNHLTLMPAVWERASKLLYTFNNPREVVNMGLLPLQLVLGASVGLEVHKMAAKLKFDDVTVMDILERYSKDQALRKRIRGMVEAGHISELAKLAEGVALSLKKWDLSVILFAIDLPNDTCQIIFSNLRSEDVDLSDPKMEKALADLYIKMSGFELRTEND